VTVEHFSAEKQDALLVQLSNKSLDTVLQAFKRKLLFPL